MFEKTDLEQQTEMVLLEDNEALITRIGYKDKIVTSSMTCYDGYKVKTRKKVCLILPLIECPLS